MTRLLNFVLIATVSLGAYSCQTIRQNPMPEDDNAVFVTSMVKILNGHREEALYYYENNWKIFREYCVSNGHCRSYEILIHTDTTSSEADLVLTTVFADQAQYEAIEDVFQDFYKDRTEGPNLLNDVQPADFRKTIGTVIGRTFAKGP